SPRLRLLPARGTPLPGQMASVTEGEHPSADGPDSGLHLPGERSAPRAASPARVRRGIRNIRATSPRPSRCAATPQARPGRPPGSKNHRPARHYGVGQTANPELTLAARRERAGLKNKAKRILGRGLKLRTAQRPWCYALITPDLAPARAGARGWF